RECAVIPPAGDSSASLSIFFSVSPIDAALPHCVEECCEASFPTETGSGPPGPLRGIAPMTNGLRVLVVDDYPDSLTTLRWLLQAWGYEVAEAPDGPSALSSAASFVPDVVLLDIGLPGMDGYEVARQLRALPGQGKTLLVALTGFGQVADVERCLQAGCDT